MFQKLSKYEVKVSTMWKFYNMPATQIFCEIKFWLIQTVKRSKMSFLAMFQVLNFDFSKFEQLSSPKFSQIHSSESLNVPIKTFLDSLNLPKFDFTKNLSAGKIVHFNKVKP